MITFQFLFLYLFALNSCCGEVESANYRPKDGGIDEKLSELELELNAVPMKLRALELRYHQQEDRLQSLENLDPQTRRAGKAGVTYIRWGRTTCPTGGTKTVYTGYAAGSHYKNTGGVDYLCLPADPVAGPSTPAIKYKSTIYGAEYEVHGVGESEALFGDQLGHHDVPCSVCQSNFRPSILMIPGRFQCYYGWHLEYHGYLMSSYYSHVSSKTFACMDKNAEKSIGGVANENGALFYPVVTKCGSLPCPPYKDDQVVSCSVCTK